MKLLLDQSLPALTAGVFRDMGHDAVHASEIGMRRAPDTDYLSRGAADGSIVVTLDADFHDELTKKAMTAPSTIHLRIHNPDEVLAATVIHELCREYRDELLAGCALTYKPDSRRFRRLPIERSPSS